ncbi:uncharacterized protein LOC110465408 [Mizuhopecten yessoensis]|uniref:Uncharacterized protein n=1 Tax=Mizuhopecten yessoensis TaxID=6573 RepID=A0A210PRS4_MIZYE|nr:uncharacterized protein LOC110465408 [Mizuhopecten yessoensis]OWF39152.1 hypothetical protein KP79_PYT07155 [Mizuhopecten yessoensis]
MLIHAGWRLLLLLVIGVVHNAECQQMQVVISHIRYSCPLYPCSLRICGYVLPSLRLCPIHTTTCPNTNCQDVIILSPSLAGNNVGLSLDYPPQLKSILNIKVYFPQPGSTSTCGSSLRDSCWDFTYTSTNLITGSSLSFQVQISKSVSTLTSSPSTASTTSTKRTTLRAVVSTLRPAPTAKPLPTPFKANSQADDRDGFPAAGAFGIALGVAVLILFLVIIICLCCKKKKKETVVAVVSSPRTTEKLVYPAPLRYEEYMKSGPLPVVQDVIDGDGGSDTSCYQIEMVADTNTPKSKKKRKNKRKSGKHSKRERDVNNESDFSRTTGENYHIAVDTFFINAATMSQSENTATPLTLPQPTPKERTPSKKYKKKRKMASYDFTEFDGNSDRYNHM